MAKGKTIDREQVQKNILGTSDPTGDMLDSIMKNVFNNDSGISKDLDANRDKFINSLSQTLKSIDSGFSGDISGSLYKYYSSKGDEEELNKLKSILGGLDDAGGDGTNIDNNLLTLGYLSYNSNIQRIKDIEMLVSMIPQFQEALDTMADSIVSSDNFSNFVSLDYKNGDPEHSKTLDSKYDMFIKLRKGIRDALEFGYGYTAVIDYKKAFQKFKMNSDVYKDAVIAANNKRGLNESACNTFTESIDSLIENNITKFKDYVSANKDKAQVNELINESELINSAKVLSENTKLFLENVEICEDFTSLLESDNMEELSEVMKQQSKAGKIKEKMAKATMEPKGKKGDDDINKFSGSKANPGFNDGLLNAKTAGNISVSEIDISGCIIKNLDTKKLIAVKIDDTVLKYFYIEEKGIIDNVNLNTMDPMMALTTMGTMSMQDKNTELERANDKYFKDLSDVLIGSMVKDKDFLKKNIKFKEQIYSILRYGDLLNKNLKITALTPDEVVEWGNGESMVDRSLFYGKLYLALLITNIMIKISRGYDKRIYLVKSSVPAESSASVLDAIREVKKDNRSVTMLTNVNSILNMAGSANDLFFPMDAQGNKPIDYDVMAGQDVSIKDELLEFLEDRMLSGMGTPTPLLQASTEVDFSRSLVMLNSKYLRRVLSWQRIFNNDLCIYYNRVNAADMGLDISNDEYDIIVVYFLPPSALGITAMNEQVGNAKDLVDTINRAYTDSGIYGDKVTGEFARNLLTELCPLLPWKKIDAIFTETVQKTAIKEKEFSSSEDEGM